MKKTTNFLNYCDTSSPWGIYSQESWSIISPPKPHAFVSLPLQSSVFSRFKSKLTLKKILILLSSIIAGFFVRNSLIYMFDLKVNILWDCFLLGIPANLFSMLIISILQHYQEVNTLGINSESLNTNVMYMSPLGNIANIGSKAGTSFGSKAGGGIDPDTAAARVPDSDLTPPLFAPGTGAIAYSNPALDNDFQKELVKEAKRALPNSKEAVDSAFMYKENEPDTWSLNDGVKSLTGKSRQEVLDSFAQQRKSLLDKGSDVNRDLDNQLACDKITKDEHAKLSQDNHKATVKRLKDFKSYKKDVKNLVEQGYRPDNFDDKSDSESDWE